LLCSRVRKPQTGNPAAKGLATQQLLHGLIVGQPCTSGPSIRGMACTPFTVTLSRWHIRLWNGTTGSQLAIPDCYLIHKAAADTTPQLRRRGYHMSAFAVGMNKLIMATYPGTAANSNSKQNSVGSRSQGLLSCRSSGSSCQVNMLHAVLEHALHTVLVTQNSHSHKQCLLSRLAHPASPMKSIPVARRIGPFAPTVPMPLFTACSTGCSTGLDKHGVPHFDRDLIWVGYMAD
jgi:hypothetical protein